MTTNRLQVEVRNVLDDEEPAKVSISVDAAKSWRELSSKETKVGVDVQPGTLHMKIQKAGRHTIIEGYNVTSTSMSTASPDDRGAWLQLMSVSGGVRLYKLMAWVRQFRVFPTWTRGWPNPPIEKQKKPVFDFPGPEVLNPAGRGYGRLSATLREDIEQHDQSSGEIVFLEAPKSAPPPRLVAVFVPTGMTLTDRPDALTFFLPKPREDHKPYPSNDYYRERINAYFVEYFQMLHQHVLKTKRTLFVFPMPKMAGYFDAIQRADRLKRFLLEVVFGLNVERHGPRPPVGPLGRCAAAGFSRGGDVLVALMRTSLRHEFDALREIYSLDGELASMVGVSNLSVPWLKGGVRGRRVRMYASWKDLASYRPPFAKGPPRTSGGAKEWTTRKATYVHAPLTFWQQMHDELPLNAPRPFTWPRMISAHSTLPKVFLSHALATSAFK